MFCDQCGEKNSDQAKFCMKCRARIGTSVPEPTTDKTRNVEAQCPPMDKILGRLKNYIVSVELAGVKADGFKYDIVFVDKAVVFIPIEGYSEFGVAGGVLLQAAAIAYNKLQEKKHSSTIEVADIPGLIADGKAVLALNPKITVYPCAKEGFFEVIGFDNAGCRATFRGEFLVAGKTTNGRAWFGCVDSPKDMCSLFAGLGFSPVASAKIAPKMGIVAMADDD